MSKKLSSHFENNRHSILQAASVLFCSHGVHATSISDIAKSVKLSKGTVSYYFPSKDHLIFEVTEYHLSEITDGIFIWIEQVSADMALKEVLSLLLASVFHTADQCRLHVCLISDAIMGNEVVRNQFVSRMTKWRTMVEAGLVKVGCARVKTVTEALFVSLDSIIINRALNAADIRIEEISEHIASYV